MSIQDDHQLLEEAGHRGGVGAVDAHFVASNCDVGAGKSAFDGPEV